MLDFTRRVGFEMRLYRAQAKGEVKSGVKYTCGATSGLRYASVTTPT